MKKLNRASTTDFSYKTLCYIFLGHPVYVVVVAADVDDVVVEVIVAVVVVMKEAKQRRERTLEAILQEAETQKDL